MTITISLNNEYDMFKYLLINTTTVNVTLSQPRFSDKYSGFMWVVKANDVILKPNRTSTSPSTSQTSGTSKATF